MSSGREFSWGIVALCWNCPDLKNKNPEFLLQGKALLFISYLLFASVSIFLAMHTSIVHYLFILNEKKVVCGTATERLWTSYDGSQSMKGIQLNNLVKLCLGDPSFPAFVEEVEKELNKIIKEQGKTPDSHQD